MDYDIIGFASGIYAGDFHKSIRSAIKSISLEGKKVFLVYTCGMRYRDHAKHIKRSLQEKAALSAWNFTVGALTRSGFQTRWRHSKKSPVIQGTGKGSGFYKKTATGTPYIDKLPVQAHIYNPDTSEPKLFQFAHDFTYQRLKAPLPARSIPAGASLNSI